MAAQTNPEAIDSSGVQGPSHALHRLFDAQTGDGKTVWIPANIFNHGTIQVKKNGTVSAFTLEIFGLNIDGSPSEAAEGHELISDITAEGITKLDKLPVSFIQAKLSGISGGGSLNVWMQLST